MSFHCDGLCKSEPGRVYTHHVEKIENHGDSSKPTAL